MDKTADPFLLFETWFEQASQEEHVAANVMSLACTDGKGFPSLRNVLFKGYSGDPKGLRFFTNYGSCKAQALAENPHAAALFYWASAGRQVRLEGNCQKLDGGESDVYFASRPRQSQLGVWASRQSEEIPSRDVLEAQLVHFEQRFAGEKIPRPDWWGGYRLVPSSFEFWCSRPNRLHDRLLYQLDGSAWNTCRLAP